MVEAVLIGVAIALVLVAISLLVLWINSRGKFMFIDAIANNTSEVRAPWTRLRPLGNSLFAFRVCLLATGFAIALVVGGGALLLALPDIRAETFGGGAVAAIVIFLVLFVPAVIALALIGWATENFVAHIMYATGQSVMPAWREFRAEVMPGNVGSLVLFLLMQFLLGIAVGVGQLLLGCLTCCIGLLPYLSSVVALPLLVFMRAYPMYFMQQVSSRYVVMIEPPPPPLGFPMYPYPQPPGVTPQPALQQPAPAPAAPPGPPRS